MPAFFIFIYMKKLLLLACLLMALASQAQTNYLTVTVSMALKNKMLLHRMTVDVGTNSQHPLYNKVTNTSGGVIAIQQADGKEISFTNEIDLLGYLENNGWDLVSVNEVMIIDNKYLQYLFKSE